MPTETDLTMGGSPTATIPAPTGYTDPPDLWAQWLEDATDDVKGVADPATAARLRRPENLIRWQRTLAVLDGDVNARMGEGRLRLEAAKPEPGSPDRKAWYDARREHAERHARQVRFRNSVHERLRECRFLLAEHGLSERMATETVLEMVARATDMLDRDDLDAAYSLLNSVLRDAQRAVE